jgi:hypothetical protein
MGQEFFGDSRLADIRKAWNSMFSEINSHLQTGTLTEGKMKVEQVWIEDKTYYFSGKGMAPLGELCTDKEAKVCSFFSPFDVAQCRCRLS